MLLYFFVVFFLYYLIVGLFILGWHHAGARPVGISKPRTEFISIVVPVRNEEKNIANLLAGIERQSLPKDQFELIIIDDQSEDGTVEIINKFIVSGNVATQLRQRELDAKHQKSPKKSALSMGISEARGEIIVTTDGDCRIGDNWLNSMLDAFDQEEVKFVSGPVALQGSNQIFAQIQTIEFASLIGTGGAMINLSYPLICNGANLAFRKSAFNHVGGYHGNIDTSTGDDVFLMQKIHRSFKKSIKFLKDPRALVYSDVEKSLSSLIHQRKRWASKWNKYLLPFSWVLPVFLFVHYLTFFFAIVALFIFPHIFLTIGIMILIKFVADYIFLKKVMNFCKLRLNISMFLLCELLYPFYVVLFGVIVHFGKFTWKGRSYKN